MTTLQRNSGLIESQLAKGSGLRFASYEAFVQTDIDRVCNSVAMVMDTGRQAQSVLTFGGQPTAGQTIVIGKVVYTFRDRITTTAPYQILKGATEAATIANTAAAIDGSGVSNGVASPGTGPHPLVMPTTYDATTLTVGTRITDEVAPTVAVAETLGTGSWSVTPLTGGWQNAPITNGRINNPMTLCAQINQGAPANGTFRIRLRGRDMFGQAQEEVSPVVDLRNDTDNFIYLAKVFSVVDAVEYQVDSLTAGTLFVGPRLDLVRTETPGTVHHIGGYNQGIGIPLRLQYTPLLGKTANRYNLRRDELFPGRRNSTLTFTMGGATPIDGDTATIDGVQYTFRTVLAAAYDVLIGGSATAAVTNLTNAINLGGTIGTDYGLGTAIHPTVRASLAGLVMTVTAKLAGAQGNVIAATDTMTDASNTWAAGIMDLGIDDNGEVLGVMFEYIAGSTPNWVPRTQFVVGYSESGWSGTLEKLGFIRSQGTYVTGDTAAIMVSLLTQATNYK